MTTTDNGPRTRPRTRPITAIKGRAADRQAVAAARRMQIGHVRAAVRSQLADSQRRRQELSQALATLRKGLVDFRTQLRSRLREMSHELAHRKAIRS
jgi:hypothetical protein